MAETFYQFIYDDLILFCDLQFAKKNLDLAFYVKQNNHLVERKKKGVSGQRICIITGMSRG